MYKGEAVNVIMPVYNEGNTVYNIIKRVLKQKSVDTLIIIYDKSSDNTLSEIKRALAGAGRKATIVYSDVKKGKGHAVRLGIERIKGGIVIIQDADDEYYPEDYGKMLASLSDKNPVFGYRKINNGHKYLLGELATQAHTLTFNLLYGQKLKDINAAYKVFKLSMLHGERLRQDGWELDPEIAVKLSKNGYAIRSISIRYKGRTFSEGKKIGVSGAVGILAYIIKARFFD
ncbi:MAG: glycosyltransferase family 2 protein [Candidatus Marsarchaeota archaeon]|jgi:glycosyltransferase involved in cell wall biosynthesis|nr:glycosyltransferase family 2 protein [Candidatus Marsarchaeota archaeon]